MVYTATTVWWKRDLMFKVVDGIPIKHGVMSQMISRYFRVVGTAVFQEKEHYLSNSSLLGIKT